MCIIGRADMPGMSRDIGYQPKAGIGEADYGVAAVE
jgi:hypothetical protein